MSNDGIGKKSRFVTSTRARATQTPLDDGNHPSSTDAPTASSGHAGEASSFETRRTNDPATTLPPTSTSGSATRRAIAQIAGLRASKKSPPKTAAGRMAVLGVKLAPVKRFFIRAAVSALLGLAMLPGTWTESGAQTVYVNVNGAKPTSPEYRGAEQAAREHKEPFTAVRPADLEAVLKDVEAGHSTLRKLVPSGHSSGLWFAGEDAHGRNSLGLTEMADFATKYPKAFGEVQFFFAMACNAGTEENSRQWMNLFPNSHALVGFDHIGPASDRPAAGAVLTSVDRELSKVDWKALTRDDALKLGQRLAGLPGVEQTEFAIRLRANDGSSVYFSKLNAPTTLTTAQDLVDQLRTTGFTPYFEASEGAFANPPPGHDEHSPVRQFYNATQSMLNALGRDLTAQGMDPKTNQDYARVTHEKEAALKLIYFPVVKANVELKMRERFNAATKELAAANITLAVPKLTTLSRHQIVELGKSLRDVPAYQLKNFQALHATDIGLVSNWTSNNSAYRMSMGGASITDIHERANDGRLESVRGQLQNLEKAPPEVQAAGKRLLEAMASPRSAVVEDVRRMIDRGLGQLDDGVFPPDWVTTEVRG